MSELQPYKWLQPGKKWEIITSDSVGTINYWTVDGNSGSLNENVPHRLVLLSIWSTVGSTVREGLRGVPLLEEVYQKLPPFPESSHPHPHPWLQLAAQDECSQLSLSLNLYSVIMDSTLWNHKPQIKYCLVYVALVMMFYDNSRKVTKMGL